MKKIEEMIAIPFQPRMITLKNPNQKFADFLKQVLPVVNGQRVFIENSIFQEIWRECENYKGHIDIPMQKGECVLFTFSYYKHKKEAPSRYMICVHSKNKNHQQLELLYVNTPSLYFKSNKEVLQEKFYFQRSAENSLTMQQ